MYESHWGLKELPCENTPDPKFFYSSEKHQEALSRFEYLLQYRKSCGVLTGVYGCGKTLLLHALMRSMEAQGNRFSVVTNPRLDDLGMLRMILHGFKKGEVPTDKSEVLMQLERFVQGVADDGKHSVIVIDEAHAIENDKVFEELRLLMNFQTESRFLVTLLLAGQPELKSRVEANKQLNQRIALRFHLGPFAAEDTRRYVSHRLQVAGARSEGMFSPAALDAVHRHSGGIPRWINQICHMGLLIGFSQKSRVVSPEMVEEATQDLAGIL